MNTWKDFHVGYYVETKDGYRGIVIGIFRGNYDFIAVKFPPFKKPDMASHNCDVLGDERFIEGGPDPEAKGCSYWYFPKDLTIIKNIGLGDRVYSEELHQSGTVKCICHIDIAWDDRVYGVEFDSPVEGDDRDFKCFTRYAVGNEQGREGEVVLDCFMCSGSTGVACLNTNRNFIGIELDEGYFEIAKERIEEAANKTK